MDRSTPVPVTVVQGLGSRAQTLSPSPALILVLLQGCRAAWGALGIALERRWAPQGAGRPWDSQLPLLGPARPEGGSVSPSLTGTSLGGLGAGGRTGRISLSQETQWQVPEGLAVAWLQVWTRIPSIVPPAMRSSRPHVTARGFHLLPRTRTPLPSSLSSGPGAVPQPGSEPALVVDHLPLLSGRAELATSTEGRPPAGRRRGPGDTLEGPQWGT